MQCAESLLDADQVAQAREQYQDELLDLHEKETLEEEKQAREEAVAREEAELKVVLTVYWFKLFHTAPSSQLVAQSSAACCIVVSAV